MRGRLCKERAGGAAPAGAQERTRCSRPQSPPSSPYRAGGAQLGEEKGRVKQKPESHEGWAAEIGTGYTVSHIHSPTHVADPTC